MKYQIAIAFLLLTLSLMGQSAGRDAESQIRLRIDRLEQSLQESPSQAAISPISKRPAGK